MKTEDFERLKQICEKEGFEVITESPYENDKFFVVKKKDPWERCEFAECVLNSESYTIGKIYKINPEFLPSIKTYQDDFGRENGQGNIYFKPSTEEDYIEQLKKTAYEKFGEIKEGDKFINPNGGKDTRCKEAGWAYRKEFDWLYYGTCMLYKQGKWAKKLPERVKVKLLRERYGQHPLFQFKIINGKIDYYDSYKIGEFLAQQLENHLNNENTEI